MPAREGQSMGNGGGVVLTVLRAQQPAASPGEGSPLTTIHSGSLPACPGSLPSQGSCRAGCWGSVG